MKNILLTFFVCGVLFCSHTSIGQSRFSRSNQLAIDKAKAEITKSCGAFGSSKEASSSQIKADKKLIEFFNEFYNKDLSIGELTKKLDELYKKKWKFDITDLGGVKKYETKIAAPGNLTASISFAVFQYAIVFKKIKFETITRTNCISPGQHFTDTQDLNYLDIFCLQLIDFPVNFFCAKCGAAQSDIIYAEKLKSYQGSEYKLVNADSIRFNEMIWYAADVYHTDFAEPEFAALAKNHNSYMLLMLLCSPNQIMAVNAMEALTFLQATGIINLQPDILQKMEAVKTSPVKIKSQTGDGIKDAQVYKDLNILQEQIVAKYNQAIEKIK